MDLAAFIDRYDQAWNARTSTRSCRCTRPTWSSRTTRAASAWRAPPSASCSSRRSSSSPTCASAAAPSLDDFVVSEGPRPRRTTRVAASSGTASTSSRSAMGCRPQGRLPPQRPALSDTSVGGLAWANEVRRRRRRRRDSRLRSPSPAQATGPLYWPSIRRLRLNGLRRRTPRYPTLLQPHAFLLEGGARCRRGPRTCSTCSSPPAPIPRTWH